MRNVQCAQTLIENLLLRIRMVSLSQHNTYKIKRKEIASPAVPNLNWYLLNVIQLDITCIC